jgi:hypothetical protein
MCVYQLMGAEKWGGDVGLGVLLCHSGASFLCGVHKAAFMYLYVYILYALE